MQQPHENIALAFVRFLIDKQFLAAYQLLSASAQLTISLADLEKNYLAMVGYFKTPANLVKVIEFLSDWPGQLFNDLAWVYVSIDNKSSDAEAVSVTLERCQANAEKSVTIKSIEWGRP